MADEQTTDPYPNAGRPSGYTTPEGAAIGEDLVNKVTILVGASQTKILELAQQFQADQQHQDRRFDYVLRQLEAFLLKEDQRHDVYSVQMDAIAEKQDTTLAAVEGVRSEVGKMSARVEVLELGQQEQAYRIADLGEGQSELREDVTGLITRVDTVETRLGAVEKGQNRLDTRMGRLEEAMSRLGREIAANTASLETFRHLYDAAPPPEPIRRLIEPGDATE